MDKEKWHHLCLNCFPALLLLFMPPAGWIFAGKIMVQFKGSLSAIVGPKKGRNVALLGNYFQVTKTKLEQLQELNPAKKTNKKPKNLLMEKARKEGDRKWGKTRADRQAYMHLTHHFPSSICVSPYPRVSRGSQMGILSTRSLSHKTCLLINTTGGFLCLCHRTESRLSRFSWIFTDVWIFMTVVSIIIPLGKH